MRIGPVPEIMEEGGTQGNRPFTVVPKAVAGVHTRVISLEVITHFPGNFIHPQAVAEAGVFCTVEGERGGAQLFNPAQPLKLGCVNQV